MMLLLIPTVRFLLLPLSRASPTPPPALSFPRLHRLSSFLLLLPPKNDHSQQTS